MTRRAPNGAPMEERLRLHMIEAPSGCWIWVGFRHPNGYGRIGFGGRSYNAHRVSYETFVGPIPEGLDVDHLCRRRACIRPLHLQPVTRRENVLRGSSRMAQLAQRDKCMRGHPFEWRPDMSGRRCYECNRQGARALRLRKKDAA